MNTDKIKTLNKLETCSGKLLNSYLNKTNELPEALISCKKALEEFESAICSDFEKQEKDGYVRYYLNNVKVVLGQIESAIESKRKPGQLQTDTLFEGMLKVTFKKLQSLLNYIH